jgi:D-glycero-D-manno-heptose 1,7-bisphosphate phosphatase
LFLDRDGVIIEQVEFLHDPAALRLVNGASQAIAAANRADIAVVEVTNQSGIGRGYFGWDAFQSVEAAMRSALAAGGAAIDLVIACPHHPAGLRAYRHPDHPARKPNPGMMLRAAGLAKLDLGRSWMVGDKADDIAAGKAAGLAGGVHVLTGHGRVQRDAALALADGGFSVRPADSIADLIRLLPELVSGSEPRR